MQGTSSTQYFTGFGPSSIFLFVNHAHRYDIPNGYNEKYGYIYKVLLFDEDNNIVAIGENHPIYGEKLFIKETDKYFTKNGEVIWNLMKNLAYSSYKDEIIEKNKIY